MDYDIDSVSLATFFINRNGVMPFHSPYIDYSSVEALNKSLELPYPTGEEFQYKGNFRGVDPNRRYREYEEILPYIGATNLTALEGIHNK